MIKKTNELGSERLRAECKHMCISFTGMSRSDMIVELKNHGLYEVDTRYPAKPPKIDTSNRNDDLSNVFVGNGAGRYEHGYNKLYISNSDTHEPLIGGDFGDKVVNIHDVLNVSDTYDFSVNTKGSQGDIRRHKNKLYFYKSKDENSHEGWYAFKFDNVLVV